MLWTILPAAAYVKLNMDTNVFALQTISFFPSTPTLTLIALAALACPSGSEGAAEGSGEAAPGWFPVTALVTCPGGERLESGLTSGQVKCAASLCTGDLTASTDCRGECGTINK